MSVRDNLMINGNTDEEAEKLGEIIGTTGDTGGTATAGTLIAKVNAILNTVVNGVKVSGEVTIKETAQTKKFTNIVVKENISTTAYSVTGCGLARIMCTNYQGDVTLIVDGISIQYMMYSSNYTWLNIHFEKSFSIKSNNSSHKLTVIIQS